MTFKQKHFRIFENFSNNNVFYIYKLNITNKAFSKIKLFYGNNISHND